MPKPQTSSASIETQISNQIKYLGVVIYFWMDKTNNWGGFTKAAITQHYCYHLLNIPLSTHLTSEDLDKFNEEIDRLAGEYNLINLLPDSLFSLIKEFKIEIQEKLYGISEVMGVNKILESLGSNKRICAGFYGAFRSFIFGEVTEEKINSFNVYYIEKEIPHISSLMCSSSAELINTSDVLIIGNSAEEFKDALKNLGEDQVVVDLVRTVNSSNDIKAKYYGICW